MTAPITTPGTADGLHVGDLPLQLAVRSNAETQGAVFYQPEEVLVGSSDRRSSPALQVRARVIEVVRTDPLARVLLATTPPSAAFVPHRDLGELNGDVEVTVPHHALRIIGPVTASARPRPGRETGREQPCRP
ncbi:hypothetical protein ACWEOE_34575 [Amycolatopsis sp. NPDC004368]